MADFDNTDKGSLHKNDRKTRDNHPDYRGDALPVCAHCGQKSDYWLSAWIKTARNDGKKWMSLAFSPNKPAIKSPEPSIDFDDDIPF